VSLNEQYIAESRLFPPRICLAFSLLEDSKFRVLILNAWGDVSCSAVESPLQQTDVGWGAGGTGKD